MRIGAPSAIVVGVGGTVSVGQYWKSTNGANCGEATISGLATIVGALVVGTTNEMNG